MGRHHDVPADLPPLPSVVREVEGKKQVEDGKNQVEDDEALVDEGQVEDDEALDDEDQIAEDQVEDDGDEDLNNLTGTMLLKTTRTRMGLMHRLLILSMRRRTEI